MRTQKAFNKGQAAPTKIDLTMNFASPKQSPKKLFNELASAQGNAKTAYTLGICYFNLFLDLTFQRTRKILFL